MDLQIILLLIAGLLVVISLVQPMAIRLGLSPSVLLAVVGVAMGLVSTFLVHSNGADTFDKIAKVIVDVPIHSDAFIYIFLPLLLFQSALTIEVRQIVEDAAPILLLAVVAVLVATVVIGVALAPLAGVSIVACLMLGSIVATTDPVAVIGIFHDVGAPSRLSRLVEGESLLNDAAAITLFDLLLEILVSRHSAHPGAASLTFVRSFLGGIATGYVGARLIIGLLPWLHDIRLAQVTMTLALPYLVFIVGEQQLEVSGVVAAVTAGLALSAIGQPRIAPNDWRFLQDLWEQLAFWASSLIFILAALLVPRLLVHVGWHDVLLLGVLVVAATVARALVLFGLLPTLSALRLSQAVNNRFKAVILWGGLRGAVTLALALAVTENTPHQSRRSALHRGAGHRLRALHPAGQRHHAALVDPAAGAGPPLRAGFVAARADPRAVARPRRRRVGDRGRQLQIPGQTWLPTWPRPMRILRPRRSAPRSRPNPWMWPSAIGCCWGWWRWPTANASWCCAISRSAPSRAGSSSSC